jgi:23S rRNA pseudouridine2457 synthase
VDIAFWKPYAVLTQFTAEGSDKTTLAKFGFPPRVYPVGRLDFDSEGLLILSDDASLNAALLRPERGHTRVYWAQVENVPTADALKRLRAGVIIEGRRTMPADAKLLESEPDVPPRPVPIRYRKNIPTAWIELTLTEGKNRQVRKMTAAVGHPTLRLMRAAIGELKLLELGLQPGEWRALTPGEVDLLFD